MPGGRAVRSADYAKAAINRREGHTLCKSGRLCERKRRQVHEADKKHLCRHELTKLSEQMSPETTNSSLYNFAGGHSFRP